MIEAFVTWEDGTTSTITARDFGEMFLQINSDEREMVNLESHIIEEGKVNS